MTLDVYRGRKQQYNNNKHARGLLRLIVRLKVNAVGQRKLRDSSNRLLPSKQRQKNVDLML